MGLLQSLGLRETKTKTKTVSARDAPSQTGTPPDGQSEHNADIRSNAVLPVAATPAELQHRFTVRVAGELLSRVTRREAMYALGRELGIVHAKVDGDFETHRYLIKIRMEKHSAAAQSSEPMDAAEIPPIEIWDEPRALLREVAPAFRAGAVESCAALIAAIDAAHARSHELLMRYRNAIETGGERALRDPKSS